MGRNTNAKAPGEAPTAPVAAPAAKVRRTRAARIDAAPVPTDRVADADAQPAVPATDTPRPRQRRKPFVL